MTTRYYAGTRIGAGGVGVSTNYSGGLGMNFLVGALMLMFVLYIAVKGSLPKYLGMLIYRPPATGGASIPGEHVSGSVDSDKPETKKQLEKEPNSFGPLLDPFLKGFFK